MSRSAILASPAVRLLSDRVRAGGDELTIDDSTAPLIAALCARCGGLPLALELAAAQLCVMPVGDLLDHLSDVVAGGRPAPVRSCAAAMPCSTPTRRRCSGGSPYLTASSACR